MILKKVAKMLATFFNIYTNVKKSPKCEVFLYKSL